MNSTPNYGSIPSTSTSFSPTEFLILKEQIYLNLVVIKKNANKLDKIYKVHKRLYKILLIIDNFHKIYHDYRL